MKKWIILLALLSPTVARANTITPQFSQGSMSSTTTTTQTIQETVNQEVFGAEVKTWSGTNVTPSSDLSSFTVNDGATNFQYEVTVRAAGVIETIDITRDIDLSSTTTSLSVFSQ